MIDALPPGVDTVAPFWERVQATFADADWGGLARHQRRPMPAELQFPPRMADCHPDRPHKANGFCVACYAGDSGVRS